MHSAYCGQLPGRQVFLDLEMGGALVLFKQNQDLANGGDTRFHILDQHIIGKAVVPQKQIQDLTSSDKWGFSTFATYI